MTFKYRYNRQTEAKRTSRSSDIDTDRVGGCTYALCKTKASEPYSDFSNCFPNRTWGLGPHASC
uniref:Uncharacterized protein n=1 Tax=Setaria italica TaxID=4555 RepID=K3Y0Q1_SETIT